VLVKFYVSVVSIVKGLLCHPVLYYTFDDVFQPSMLAVVQSSNIKQPGYELKYLKFEMLEVSCQCHASVVSTPFKAFSVPSAQQVVWVSAVVAVRMICSCVWNVIPEYYVPQPATIVLQLPEIIIPIASCHLGQFILLKSSGFYTYHQV
jgi:hypothetical protein